LSVLFDSLDVVEEVLQDLSNIFNVNSFVNINKLSYEDNDNLFNTIFEMSIPFITDNNELEKLKNDLNSTEDTNIPMVVDNSDYLICFTIRKSYSSGNVNDYVYKFNGFTNRQGADISARINPYQILLLAFRKCRSLQMV
jgi:hypothetical protein